MQRSQFNRFPYAASSDVAPSVHRPLVSVVLPVYNQTGYLEESIASVLQQENCDLELVIVDDGSEAPVAEAFAAQLDDPRVRLIRQENRGLANALNRGMESAKGTFLTWTSADNAYLPGALARMRDFLIANPKVGFVYANVELMDEAGQPARNTNYRPQDQDPSDSARLLLPLSAETLALWHDNFINACFMYRSEVRDVVGTYNPDFRGYEDYDYWLRTQQNFELAHLDSLEPYYRYRLHDDSLTGTLDLGELEADVAKLVAGFRQQRTFYGSRPAVPADLLRRARESNFAAIAPATDSRATLVTLTPEERSDDSSHAARIEQIRNTIEQNPTITFALLCFSPSQRRTADACNLALKRNDNLRIIDLSPTLTSDGKLSDETWLSTMYALSSADGILRIEQDQADPSSTNALYAECALAALAGIAIVLLRQGEITDNTTATISAPHLVVVTQLAEVVGKLSEGIDLNSAEQWLAQLSLAAEVRDPHEVILAKHPEPL